MRERAGPIRNRFTPKITCSSRNAELISLERGVSKRWKKRGRGEEERRMERVPIQNEVSHKLLAPRARWPIAFRVSRGEGRKGIKEEGDRRGEKRKRRKEMRREEKRRGAYSWDISSAKNISDMDLIWSFNSSLSLSVLSVNKLDNKIKTKITNKQK